MGAGMDESARLTYWNDFFGPIELRFHFGEVRSLRNGTSIGTR